MPELHPDQCAFCLAPALCERRHDGRPQCLACKVVLFFRNVLYKPIGFDLLPWQEKDLRAIYGTLQPDGLRRYRRTYQSVAKKNGKSFLIGGLPIYHLVAEDEQRPEAYGAAAAIKQAGSVFRSAASLVRANPVLQDLLKVNDSVKRIVKRDGNGFYEVLSGDGDLNDGIEPSLAIIDELHRWRAARHETAYDIITKGCMSRKQPLVVEITTAGEIYEAPICYREYELAKQKLAGTLDLPRFYVSIYEADSKRLKEDPEYWKSLEARLAANPSHEQHGGFLKDEAIVEERDKAILQPTEKTKYIRYNLNVWDESAETGAITPEQWELGNKPLRNLVDRPCYVGLDLSASQDLTCAAFLFPDDDGTWDLFPLFFLPKDVISERVRRDRVEYDVWAEMFSFPVPGTECPMIHLTDGNVVDYRFVRSEIERWSKVFHIEEIAYDPRFATETANELVDAGFVCPNIKQGYAGMALPTKWFLEAVAAGKIRHNGHPILRWMANCLAVKQNDEGELLPAKPDRRKSAKRIDGIVAAIMAFGRAYPQKPAAVEPSFRWV